MPLFGSAGVNPGVLRKELAAKLVTNSGGEVEIRNLLTKFGLKSAQALGTVVVTSR